MVRRQGTYDIEVRESMRGGKGKVRIEHYWKKPDLAARTRLCAKLILEPGSSIGPHSHDQEDEVYIVLRGCGRVTDAGTTVDIGPGDSVLTGKGASHSVESTGTEPLEMIAVIEQY